ncbi:MAG: MmgE/PrpD family protein [Pseudomonadota bacterium]
MAMDDLAHQLAHVALGPVPRGEAMDVMRLSLLDWSAVGLAGTQEPVAKILRRQAIEEGGAAQASLIGCTQKVPARMAALVNGATSHALDYDDTHFAHIGHPSVAVIPAALAAGEWADATGRAVQEAALVGVEAAVRVGVWLGRGHYQIGFHQTGTAGAFGATLAAARVLQLDAAQTAHAIGLAATRAGGLKAQFGTMGKPMNAGIAAANGVEAAMLAAKGFLSAPGAIDAAQGFGPTHHGDGDMTAFDGFGTEWLFPKVRHKFHACCHGLHAALDALAGAQKSAQDVAKIDIATHPRWMNVCNIAAPETGLEAKFSYRLVAALALLGHDTARLDTFRDALCSDTAATAVRDKVDVTADDSLSEMQARVVLTSVSGSKEELFHDLEADPGLTARRARIHAKAKALLGASHTQKLWALIDADAPPREFAAALIHKA